MSEFSFNIVNNVVNNNYYGNDSSGTLAYNVEDNSYQFFYYPNRDNETITTIEPSFNITDYVPDFSYNDIKPTDLDSGTVSISDNKTSLNVNLNYQDISFNFLIDNVFKYKL